MAGFGMDTIKTIPALFGVIFKEKKINYEPYINELVELLTKVKKGGITEIPQYLQDIHDPFLRQGMRLISEQWNWQDIEEFIDTSMESTERRHEKGAIIFESLGGYAPTFGILGTVMGLVLVLGNLSKPEELGPHIATAFIATLFGVGSANILWLPMASKLKRKSEQEQHLYDLLIDGLRLIHSQELAPVVALQRLLAHLPASQQATIKENIKARRKNRAGAAEVDEGETS